MIIRRAEVEDHPLWAALLSRLHGDLSAAEFEAELETFTQLPDPYVCFLAFSHDGRPAGMIDARVRNYAEGAPELKAPYVEDLWVEPEFRGQGVARQLLEEVEAWAREAGYNWLGSDTTPDNVQSQHWHQSVGFKVVERLVVYGKALN